MHVCVRVCVRGVGSVEGSEKYEVGPKNVWMAEISLKK